MVAGSSTSAVSAMPIPSAMVNTAVKGQMISMTASTISAHAMNRSTTNCALAVRRLLTDDGDLARKRNSRGYSAEASHRIVLASPTHIVVAKEGSCKKPATDFK